MNDKKIKLFAFPLKLKTPNAYWDNLYGEILLDKRIEAYSNNFKALLFSFHKPQIIHIHWQNVLYSSCFKWLIPLKFLSRVMILLLAKVRGDNIVWTMHNYHDHESNNEFIDGLAIKFLVKIADTVIVHTPAGVEHLKQQYHRNRGVEIVPMGHYINFYGQRLERADEELMKEFNFGSDDIVFLSLGSIRPYKGLEEIIDIFNELPDNFKLIIAGRPFYQEHFSGLQQRAKKNNIIFYGRLVANSDIPKFFSLADFSLFNFQKVLSSASLILSLSYGVPVIGPMIGDLKYVIVNNINGFSFENIFQLKDLILSVSKINDEEWKKISMNCIAGVRQSDYSFLANKTLNIYF